MVENKAEIEKDTEQSVTEDHTEEEFVYFDSILFVIPVLLLVLYIDYEIFEAVAVTSRYTPLGYSIVWTLALLTGVILVVFTPNTVNQFLLTLVLWIVLFYKSLGYPLILLQASPFDNTTPTEYIQVYHQLKFPGPRNPNIAMIYFIGLGLIIFYQSTRNYSRETAYDIPSLYIIQEFCRYTIPILWGFLFVHHMLYPINLLF